MDGYSLYKAYFAQEFMLAPSGNEMIEGPDDDVESTDTCCLEVVDSWQYGGYGSKSACVSSCFNDYNLPFEFLAALWVISHLTKSGHVRAAALTGTLYNVALKYISCPILCELDTCSSISSPEEYEYEPEWYEAFSSSETRYRCPETEYNQQ